MKMIAFAIIMVLIAAGAFASHVYIVGILMLVLTCVGIFIDQMQDHPTVRKWLEKYF